ncbi:MAG: Gp49 family protein, partial [Cetobacterium sp.]
GDDVMEKYLGVKVIEAKLMNEYDYRRATSQGVPKCSLVERVKEMKGNEGYLVEYNDGYKSFSPKEVFEKSYIKIGDNKINNETFDNFIAEEIVGTQEIFGKPTTFMHVKLVNGMVISDMTTCVDPKNYSEEIGVEILRKRIADKIWFGLGFCLQTGVYGVKKAL